MAVFLCKNCFICCHHLTHSLTYVWPLTYSLFVFCAAAPLFRYQNTCQLGDCKMNEIVSKARVCFRFYFQPWSFLNALGSCDVQHSCCYCFSLCVCIVHHMPCLPCLDLFIWDFKLEHSCACVKGDGVFKTIF